MHASPSSGESTAERPAVLTPPRGAVDLLANAPAATMATVYESMAQALCTAMHDAVAHQQSVGATRSASVAAACAKLLALQPAPATVAAMSGAPAAPQGPSGTAPHDAVIDPVAGSEAAGDLRMLRAVGSVPRPVPAEADAGDEPLRSHEGMARIIDACNFTQTAVMSPQVVLTSAAGKAHQAVALAAALAVLDAVETLRSASALMTTAAGVALAHHIATGDPRPHDAVARALQLVDAARVQLKQTGAEAASVLQGFPCG